MRIMMRGGRQESYHKNPSPKPLIEAVFLPVVSLEDEFAVGLGEGDAGVGVEFVGVLGEGGRARWGRVRRGGLR